jgi:hypothetical protein
MAGHECFHCKQWIEDGVEHDCWTTTEQALTKDLSEDLREAWERIRDTAVEFGDQRVYASHHSIMFSRKSCYFFVRPKRKVLEVVFFLGRMLKAPQIRKAARGSRTKVWHVVHIVHRDQVEPPITDWLKEAYGLQDELAAAPSPGKTGKKTIRRAGRARDSRAKRGAPAARKPAKRRQRAPRRTTRTSRGRGR